MVTMESQRFAQDLFSEGAKTHPKAQHTLRRCTSTVSCTVPSGESPDRALRRLLSWLDSQLEIHRKSGFSKRISSLEYGSQGFRVRLRRLSEYGSVACLKTNTGNTG